MDTRNILLEFLLVHDNFLPCHRMWFGKCYTSEKSHIFPVDYPVTYGKMIEGGREEEGDLKIGGILENNSKKLKGFQLK